MFPNIGQNLTCLGCVGNIWEYLGTLTFRVRRAFPINIWEHLRICGNSWHEGLVGHILECSGILGNVWECLRATPWRPAIGPSRAPTDTHTQDPPHGTTHRPPPNPCGPLPSDPPWAPTSPGTTCKPLPKDPLI